MVNLNTDGIYRKEQRTQMIEITQKGDAVKQVVSHITQAVHENTGTLLGQFTGLESLLDPALTAAIQAGITPFPYSLLSFIPIWIRVTGR